jgi:hypothetical protein
VEQSDSIVDAGEEVFGLTPFDRDGVASEYAVVPSAVLAPKPTSLSHAPSSWRTGPPTSSSIRAAVSSRRASAW